MGAIVTGSYEQNRPSNRMEHHLITAKTRGALTGGAFGDALGWPFEGRAKKVAELRSHDPGMELFSWTKRGGRFHPDEPINAGEYSDDTQLTLATARAVLQSKAHWERFAFVELPTWLLYERGGGRATKAAARALALGSLPWEHSKTPDCRAYFQAGGNGVAMRILPLSIVHSSKPSFSELAQAVMANGVTTHGHPRALLGALALAYLHWFSLRLSGTLEYGELLRVLVDHVEAWSPLPDIEAIWPRWRPKAEFFFPQYEESWRSTVGEMNRSLMLARDALAAGALADDRQTLLQLGALDKNTNGAGTVCTIATAYLSTRHAVSPRNGVTAAATAKGADTDTLASMVGGLLGCVAGDDWLGLSAMVIQDNRYLLEIAERLSRSEVFDIPWQPVTPKDIESARLSMEHATTGSSVKMPDGRLGTVDQIQPIAASLVRRKVLLNDGQSIFLTSKERAHRKAAKLSERNFVRALLRLDVVDLSRSEGFYSRLLEMPVLRRTDKLVVFDAFALKATSEQVKHPGDRVVVMIEVDDSEPVRHKLESAKVPVELDKYHRGTRRSFRLRDPDGYLVEVLERR
jgi:ADP-ribosylglycohydrolase